MRDTDTDGRVLFLGLCRRAALHDSGLDIIGLTHTFISSFYPMQFGELCYVIGLDRAFLTSLEDLDFSFEFEDTSRPESHCSSTFHLSPASTPGDFPVLKGKPCLENGKPASFVIPYFPLEDQGVTGSLLVLAMPAPRMMLYEPTYVHIDLRLGDEIVKTEVVRFIFRAPMPLSAEERRAIAGRPSSTKAIEIELSCNVCRDKAHFYSLLNPMGKVPLDYRRRGFQLAKAPDSWTCECGSSTVPLVYAKKGIHELFRSPVRIETNEVSLVPFYEAGEIASIRDEYNSLLQQLPQEEDVQKFLEKYPVFWHFLSPVQIFHKPPILGKYNADFGVLTARKELILIEIEKPSTQLLTNDGRVASGIQKGADQIRDWAVEVDDHRDAVLSQLGLDKKTVHNIRYLLVGGLSTSVPSNGLVKLRREGLVPKTDLIFFDELGASLHVLAVSLRQL